MMPTRVQHFVRYSLIRLQDDTPAVPTSFKGLEEYKEIIMLLQN